ncbi:MAG TPA: galactokinase, partial [Myxococcota bacterium]|nr:galactokinase [Myxococcota bacterium]
AGIDGVYGARLTGAGFGGNTVNLVRQDAAVDFCDRLAVEYRGATGIESVVRVVRPASGLLSGRF